MIPGFSVALNVIDVYFGSISVYLQHLNNLSGHTCSLKIIAFEMTWD
jgi:hypothetical protein